MNGRYKIEDWAVSHLQDWTNNAIEGGNDKINRLFPRNPSPWKFVKSLQKLTFDIYRQYLNNLHKEPRAITRSKLSKPARRLARKFDEKHITLAALLYQLSLL